MLFILSLPFMLFLFLQTLFKCQGIFSMNFSFVVLFFIFFSLIFCVCVSFFFFFFFLFFIFYFLFLFYFHYPCVCVITSTRHVIDLSLFSKTKMQCMAIMETSCMHWPYVHKKNSIYKNFVLKMSFYLYFFKFSFLFYIKSFRTF